MEAFCCSVPGKLASHSEFESCAARARALVSLRSAVVVSLASSTSRGPSRSYPTARMRSEYAPGYSFADGNRYRPWSSLTTLTVIVELAFFALTITPSIGPSSDDVTSPVNATEDDVSAGSVFAFVGVKLAATARDTEKRMTLIRMCTPFASELFTAYTGLSS